MKTFYQILINTFVSSLTTSTVWFALIFFVYLQTKSVFATSIISGIYLLSTTLTGFWLGSIVDHNKKKNVMIGSNVLCLILFVIAALIYFVADESVFATAGHPVLWLWVIVILFGVIASNLRNITLPTLVKILIPEDRRDKANGLVGTVTGVSFLVVSAISGFLVSFGGMKYVFLFALPLLLISIIHLLFVKIDEDGVAEAEAQGEVGQVEGDASQTDAGEALSKKGKIDVKGTLKAIKSVPGLLALILFATFNNFLGGVFMSLLDPYGLSMVAVEVWGLLWAFISTAFIVGGAYISTKGLGKSPLRALFLANIAIWIATIFMAIQPWIILLVISCYIYLAVVPFIEAAEHTIIQKVIPQDRLGRVFGFTQSVEQAASPLTAFLIGPIAEFIVIPFMSEGGKGAELIGDWFGVGTGRGIALIFTTVGVIGLACTLLAMRSKQYKQLSSFYAKETKSDGDKS